MLYHLLAWLQTVTPVPVTGTSHWSLIGVATVLMPVVYIILQITKQAVPQLKGIWAILVNALITVIAYVIALPQDQWFTMTTLLAVSATVAGAAGFHGTVKTLANPEEPQPKTPLEKLVK